MTAVTDRLVDIIARGQIENLAAIATADMVLAALSEPTPEMVEAGEGAVDPYSYPTFSDNDAEKVWRAMIAVARTGE